VFKEAHQMYWVCISRCNVFSTHCFPHSVASRLITPSYQWI